MIDIKKLIWVADKTKMTCRNIENNITVKMDIENQAITGKIDYMPIELFGEIAELENGEKIIQEIVKIAEEEYQKEPLPKLG